MEWRDEEESVARGTGYSTGGRKDCWEQAGQLIFYKPGLERSWNEEWEKDSWESATGIKSEKEWDSWITPPLIRNICTSRGRRRGKKTGGREKAASCSIRLSQQVSLWLTLFGFFFCLYQPEFDLQRSRWFPLLHYNLLIWIISLSKLFHSLIAGLHSFHHDTRDDSQRLDTGDPSWRAFPLHEFFCHISKEAHLNI